MRKLLLCRFDRRRRGERIIKLGGNCNYSAVIVVCLIEFGSDDDGDDNHDDVV